MKVEKEKDFHISVIVSIFNRKKTIAKALNSLLIQSFKNFEVIIIDDGSIDNVEEIIFPYLEKYDFFKYFRYSNKGVSLSKNTGILHAQGKYITFLDSDDEYKKDHLERMTAAIENEKNIDFIYSSPAIIGNKDDMWLVDALDNSKLIHADNSVFGATFFGKKEIFVEMQGFKEMSYAEDFDFFQRLTSCNKYKIKKLNTKTYVYHRSIKDSITNLAKNKNHLPLFYKDHSSKIT